MRRAVSFVPRRALSRGLARGAARWPDLIGRVAPPVRLPGRGGPAIHTPEVAADADEARRFRPGAAPHDDPVVPERAAASIEAARRLAQTLAPCNLLFRDRIDPPAAG